MVRAAFTGLITLVVVAASGPSAAQGVTAGADLLFYGDNTEFTNPFREGETLFGTAGRLWLALELNDTVTLRLGVFGKGRYGSHRFLEEGEPVVSLELRRGPSSFRFGSLDTASTRVRARGPDEDTPHGLLPPLQRETLTFARAHEMGLQWRVDSTDIDHDVWINWQRLNTSAHRERFDAGARSRLSLLPHVAVHGQWHVVHEGGQQFASGPVRDSHGGALGLEWRGTRAGTAVVFDSYAVATHERPDRDRPEQAQNGIGVFARGAIARRGWRAHVLAWRSRDTLKDEGDANYLMLGRDGRQFRKTRDYGEIGFTRHFYPAPGVAFDAAVRLHRVESEYAVSYRLIARVQLRHRVR